MRYTFPTTVVAAPQMNHSAGPPESAGSAGPSWLAEGAPAPPEWPPQPTEDGVFRVCVVDDQPVTRSGMERLVALNPRLTLAASVSDVEELPPSSAACDVAVLALPTQHSGSSLELIAAVAAVGRPVVTGTWDQPPALLAAMRAGARGLLTRYSPQNAVADALLVVAQGGLYLCSRLVTQFDAELRRPRQDGAALLAPREVETLRWIAMGLTQAQIAKRMSLSEATVNTYAKRIRGKLNVGNKAELTRIAIALGYLSSDQYHHAA